MNENSKIEDLTDNVRELLTTNYAILKLEATERAAVIGAGLTGWLMIGTVAMLTVLFASIGAGFWLSGWMGDNYSGFLIVGAFYLLIMVGLLIGRKDWIEKPVRNKIVESILTNN